MDADRLDVMSGPPSSAQHRRAMAAFVSEDSLTPQEEADCDANDAQYEAAVANEAADLARLEEH